AAGHRTASGLELARGHTGTARRLQAVVAERDVIAALRKAGIATFELLAILGAFGLHHVRYLRAGPSGLLGYWLSGQIANSPVDQLAVTQAVASAGAAGCCPSAGSATCSCWLKTSPLKIQTFTPITP